MLKDVGPILSALRKHRLTASLVVLEIALTCAIVCNAVFLIGDRLAMVDLPSGIDEANVVHIVTSDIGRHGDGHARTEADLAALRAIPGVVAATISNSVPFGDISWGSGLNLSPNQQTSTVDVKNFYGERVGETLGTHLVAGRYFDASEYVWLDDLATGKVKPPPVIMITQGLARHLFGDASALSRSVWVGSGNTEMRVIGVVDHLASAGGGIDRSAIEFTTLMPWREPGGGNLGSFIIRSQPGQADRVLALAVEKLKQIDPRRVIVKKELYKAIRDDHFAGDRAMAGLLVAVCVILLVVTALGIVGLASFWVGQRRRQIGVRRALGARRVDVLRYFQTENFLLASMGIGLGMALAYGINLFLMREYELPRLPRVYLPVGAVVLWVLGQLAVLAPALRAASVPPVVATRG
ncbi:MAG TPA: FtsX-like permease family protein [Luteibacter sp.]|uniref:ABC transporter permease n=1 Tax=Luteibacter sp. TaxID=1886636 RepID=UPI002C94792C|nr:FtsX-like permease family protein [Luteibacter sp.]HVI55223.1 FtsX-like permease family protein [Luteibacter sp.]